MAGHYLHVKYTLVLYVLEWLNHVAYLLAFPMMLHIEEAINLEFESIDILPDKCVSLSSLLVSSLSDQ